MSETHTNEFNLVEGGRVKMAGGPADLYYDAADPMIQHGISGAHEAHLRFLDLRSAPPNALKAAFFPSVGQELAQRMRGAGLYRHLRMDQGPGGNFTGFTQAETLGTHQSAISLGEVRGHALLEESVRRQMNGNEILGALATAVSTNYAGGSLRDTFGAMQKFAQAANDTGISLPSEEVGSRSGFFLINPVETGAELSVDVDPEVFDALNLARAYAGRARTLILQGSSYHEAVAIARQSPEPSNYTDDALYFQPDCIVDINGNVYVEKINFPDVGFFLAGLDTHSNPALERVVGIVKKLQSQLGEAAEAHIESGEVTIIVRDEAEMGVDMLEVNEAEIIKEVLEAHGYKVNILGMKKHSAISPNATVLLLNPDTGADDFAEFTERVVKEGIPTYPDPLLKTFEFEASTLKTLPLSGKYFDRFLTLTQPKHITSKNASKVHEELLRALERGGVPQEVDILYAFVPGLRTPVPVFRYALHSFTQIYNAVAKSREKGLDVNSIVLRVVPFNRETAVFRDGNGSRLAAFRPMYMRV